MAAVAGVVALGRDLHPLHPLRLGQGEDDGVVGQGEGDVGEGAVLLGQFDLEHAGLILRPAPLAQGHPPWEGGGQPLLGGAGQQGGQQGLGLQLPLIGLGRQGGAVAFLPSGAEPEDGTGRGWLLPLPAGGEEEKNQDKPNFFHAGSPFPFSPGR